ncbi:MAG TPA: hypothetical protein VHZ33_00700 [Trebonia sp.]|nr:hypothetical protein [Trebonia sp.]
MRAKSMFLASGSALGLLAAAVGVVLGVGASGAKADTVINLPSTVNYLTQAVPDTAGGHSDLFVLANGEIIVTSLGGAPVATIDANDGINALALSADGGTLYASVTAGANAGSVAAITVSSIAGGTPKQTFYPLAAGDSPGSVAVQSGRVWVSYSATVADVTSYQIGAIDLTDGTFDATAAGGSWADNLQLAADPSDTGVLVALDYQSQSLAETFSTAAVPATVLDGPAELGSAGTPCSWLAQVAVMPGGKRFAVACTGAGSYAYATGDVATSVAYYNANGAGTSLNTGVAVDADGTVAVANRTEIYVYQPGQTLLNTLNLGTGDELLEGKGLAWADASGGPDLTAAFGVGDAKPYAVHIFDAAELKRPATLTLTATAPAAFGRPVTLHGSSVLASAAGDTSPVTITRTGPGGSETRTVTPAASGAFTLTDTPKTAGTYSYTAHVGSISSKTVTARVPLNVPVLTLTPKSSTVGYKTTLHLTATLGASHVNRSLTIEAEDNGSGKGRVIASGKVNAKGQLAVAATVTQSTTFRVAYTGDVDDAAAKAASVISVRAEVRQALTGHYGTKKVSGTSYLLYHRAAAITVAAAVTPAHPGNCVAVQTQELVKGAWHASATTGCTRLSKAGQATVRLAAGKDQLGVPYRVRVDYLGGSPQNAAGASGWGYVMIER